MLLILDSFSTLEKRVEKLSESILRLEAEKVSLGIESNAHGNGMVVEEAKLHESLHAAQVSYSSNDSSKIDIFSF